MKPTDREGVFPDNERLKVLGQYLIVAINKLLHVGQNGKPHIIDSIPELKQGIEVFETAKVSVFIFFPKF